MSWHTVTYFCDWHSAAADLLAESGVMWPGGGRITSSMGMPVKPENVLLGRVRGKRVQVCPQADLI
eukprot:3747296-Rhodomonas_salina.1